MAETTAAPKTLTINLVLQIKRGREEIEYAQKESERLHQLIASGTSTEWAIERLEKLQEMILMPSAEHSKAEIVAALKQAGVIE